MTDNSDAWEGSSRNTLGDGLRRAEREELKMRIRELEERLREVEDAHKRDLTQKDREITRLKQRVEPKLRVLSIEDSLSDQLILRALFDEHRGKLALEFVRDGVEAMDRLWRRGSFAGRPLPDLILLDLNLPKKNGHEVLLELRAYNELRHIPVLLVTTAREGQLSRYRSLVDGVFTKPCGLDGYEPLLNQVFRFQPLR